MQLYPHNPRYLSIKGQPTVIVGSGEHYGAVLNTAFDYVAYLDALAKDGLNHLRLFSGAYRELPNEFGIADNTLAPDPEHFIGPWQQAADGQSDLDQFNQAYLDRLHDFCSQAQARGIVISYVFFCFLYNDDLWAYSPMHPQRTIQGVGPKDRFGVYHLEGNDLLPYQHALVRRIVSELNRYDNVCYEVCNEPYFYPDRPAYWAWQERILQIMAETEADLPQRHLYAVNIDNGTHRIADDGHDLASIYNFHYAYPDAVAWNYHLGCVIADDETGFSGQSATPYRQEAWRFMLSGGGIFDHLDYSFTCQHPDGTAPIIGDTPGFGGGELRQQLGFLRHVLEESSVWELAPCNQAMGGAQVMGVQDERYVIYLRDHSAGQSHSVRTAPGRYRVEWLDPVRCATVHAETVVVASRMGCPLVSPDLDQDMVLRISRLD